MHAKERRRKIESIKKQISMQTGFQILFCFNSKTFYFYNSLLSSFFEALFTVTNSYFPNILQFTQIQQFNDRFSSKTKQKI
jgi:hypothetical protein